MNSFLSVTHGTAEPAVFLEIRYMGHADASARPISLVGKGMFYSYSPRMVTPRRSDLTCCTYRSSSGITFDSGGISLKPGAGMKLMRGDMGGAACMVASTWAIAKLGFKTNLVTCTPLCENMPGGHATKPGDVYVDSTFSLQAASLCPSRRKVGRVVFLPFNSFADLTHYQTHYSRPNSFLDSLPRTARRSKSTTPTPRAA